MGVDTVQPSLCHAHDRADTQSLDKPDVRFAATSPEKVRRFISQRRLPVCPSE
jgi:hypothetical protein